MELEFECIICGEAATASVSAEATESRDRPLRTLNRCEGCNMETIWIER